MNAARHLLGALLLLLAAPAVHAQEGLDAGWSAEQCAAAVADADADGLDDACELALAATFAPELLVDERDCLWDAARSRLRGAHLHLVQRAGTRVRIAYLPAYLADCGWTGVQRALRFGRASAHPGDSELIVVEIESSDGARWRTRGVYLSAHCGGRSDGRCRWFHDDALGEFAWIDGRARGAPRVWVARDKHANYPTRGACESGHWRQERCADEPVAYRFPVVPTRDLGSRQRPRHAPRGCIDGAALSDDQMPVLAGATECFWDANRPFAGWQGRDGDVDTTPYAEVLRRAGIG